MADARDRPKTLRSQKLFSLSGVVPLGAFVVLHLWVTSALLGSRAVYDRQVAFLHGPVVSLLAIVLVLAPLAYHAGYGVLRALRPRAEGHAYDNDLMFLLQRASGIVVLVFVGAHLWQLRGDTSYSTTLVDALSSTTSGVPFIALGYLVGIAATVFHLVLGLASFCITWGYTPGPASQRRARILFRVGGVVLFVIGAGIVVQVATGVRWLPAEEPSSTELLCGPAAVTAPPPERAAPPSPSSSAAPGPLPGADR